jgi:muramidase (phage lysozyme)
MLDPISGLMPNLVAFLDTIGYSEGTTTSTVTKNKGYDVIVIGLDGKREVFTDYSDHPFANNRRKSKVINKAGLISSASGKFQIELHWWTIYKKLLHLPDFSPRSQVLYTIQQIEEQRAYDDVIAGRFELAVSKCANIWASLPGANYPGQHMQKVADLKKAYQAAGGSFA